MNHLHSYMISSYYLNLHLIHVCHIHVWCHCRWFALFQGTYYDFQQCIILHFCQNVINILDKFISDRISLPRVHSPLNSTCIRNVTFILNYIGPSIGFDLFQNQVHWRKKLCIVINICKTIAPWQWKTLLSLARPYFFKTAGRYVSVRGHAFRNRQNIFSVQNNISQVITKELFARM